MMSEIRADRMGVIWIGSGKETTAVIHSFNSGFAVQPWTHGQKGTKNGLQGNSQKHPNWGTQIVNGIPAFQHTWWSGNRGMPVRYRGPACQNATGKPTYHWRGPQISYRQTIGKTPHSWEMGPWYPHQRTRTGPLNWCAENQLAWVNSFLWHSERGTWWHQSSESWYELDGFIMRQSQRHKHMLTMEVTKEIFFSDHKPVLIRIKTQTKKWELDSKPGIDPTELDALPADRKAWIETVWKRIDQIANRGKRTGHPKKTNQRQNISSKL